MLKSLVLDLVMVKLLLLLLVAPILTPIFGMIPLLKLHPLLQDLLLAPIHVPLLIMAPKAGALTIRKTLMLLLEQNGAIIQL